MIARFSRSTPPPPPHFGVEAAQSLTVLRRLLESEALPKIEIGTEARNDVPSLELLALLSTHRERVARLLLYGPRTSLPPVAMVERWRRQLGSTGSQRDIPVLVATRGCFVEFNRGVAFDATVSGIAFPLTATVHSDDAETISDNVTARFAPWPTQYAITLDSPKSR